MVNDMMSIPIWAVAIIVTLALGALKVAFSAHDRLTRHDERLSNQKSAIDEEKRRNDQQDATQTAQGLILARVDANVQTILQHQQNRP